MPKHGGHTPDRSLIFDAESIRGLQRLMRGEPGAKTQTRRIIPSKLIEAWAVSSQIGDHGEPLLEREEGSHDWVSLAEFAPIHPGDIVRAKHSHWMFRPPCTTPNNAQIWDDLSRVVRWPTGEEVADCEPDLSPLWHGAGTFGWQKRSPMFMPRWASRYWLPIVSVRAERLRDISEADAVAEGCYPEPVGTVPDDAHPDVKALAKALGAGMWTAKAMYMQRWTAGPKSWRANPWVWVYEWKEVRDRCRALLDTKTQHHADCRLLSTGEIGCHCFEDGDEDGDA